MTAPINVEVPKPTQIMTKSIWPDFSPRVLQTTSHKHHRICHTGFIESAIKALQNMLQRSQKDLRVYCPIKLSQNVSWIPPTWSYTCSHDVICQSSLHLTGGITMSVNNTTQSHGSPPHCLIHTSMSWSVNPVYHLIRGITKNVVFQRDLLVWLSIYLPYQRYHKWMLSYPMHITLTQIHLLTWLIHYLLTKLTFPYLISHAFTLHIILFI